jgi:protein TonB
MEFRRNIMLSVVIHATLITVAAGFVAGRDAGFRVPEKIITVALLEVLIKGGPSPTPDPKNNTVTDTRSEITPKKDEGPKRPSHEEIPEQKGFFPPQAGEKKETQADSGGRKGTGFDSSGVAPQSTGSGEGNSSPGNPRGSSSGETPARKGDSQGTGGSGARNPDVIGTIRAAIERAKSYPPLAKKRGVEGTATTEFTIDSKGHPENIRIVRSSGSDILDNAAKNTVVRASPFPLVRGSIEVPITFRLNRDE